jgi:hypothetical protein
MGLERTTSCHEYNDSKVAGGCALFLLHNHGAHASVGTTAKIYDVHTRRKGCRYCYRKVRRQRHIPCVYHHVARQ